MISFVSFSLFRYPAVTDGPRRHNSPNSPARHSRGRLMSIIWWENIVHWLICITTFRWIDHKEDHCTFCSYSFTATPTESSEHCSIRRGRWVNPTSVIPKPEYIWFDYSSILDEVPCARYFTLGYRWIKASASSFRSRDPLLIITWTSLFDTNKGSIRTFTDPISASAFFVRCWTIEG